MKRSSRSYRRTLAAAAATLALGFGFNAVPSAIAQEADTLRLSYGIYVSGSRVYKIKYTASLSADRYETSVTMGPKGLGKLFSDYTIEMASSGVVADGLPRPMSFTMKSAKDDEQKKISMTWSPDDPPKADRSFKMPLERAAAVKQVLMPQTPDPLTAVLNHALAGDEKPCARTLRSYNGTEVYDLEFKFLGRDEINGGGQEAYSGTAFKCEIVFVPVAGYTEKKRRKYLNQPPTYTVWFAGIVSPATSTRLLIPIRATGQAGKRNFEILASDAEMSGRPLAALSQLDN